MKNRISTLLLAVIFMLGVSSPAKAETTDLGSTPVQLDICDGDISIVSTEDTVTYTQGDYVYTSTGGCVVTQSDTSGPSANRIDVSANSEDCLEVRLTISDLNIEAQSSPMALYDNATLLLTLLGNNDLVCSTNDNSNTSKSRAGIYVVETAHLTIQGNGAITVAGGNYGAGIGGDNNRDCGTVQISGGNITACGGLTGAGIGGGRSRDGGTIVISGGLTTATGGEKAAGIGGGFGGNGGTITITDGVVTATGGLYGSGIGSGGYYSNGGIITISGGTVSAFGGEEGAGIGGGIRCDGGTITINGGSVTASCGSTAFSDHGPAGIGGGTAYGKYGIGGDIFITNATVISAGNCFAIGGGNLDNQYGCESITIGENVTLDLGFIQNKGSFYQERIDIDTQPLESAAHSGNLALFSVDAFGHSGITYQWQVKSGKDWIDIDGQTTSAASVSVTEETVGTIYRCKITNVYGNTIYTDEVESYILAFTQQPVSAKTNLKEIAALTVVSSCSNVTYRWQRSYDGETWADVANQASPTLVVTTTLSENGAYYRCIITATNGDWLASDSAQITVNTDAVTYSTDYYLEQADGSYAFVERVTVESETGASVTAGEKTFEHYTEDTTKGVHSGTVVADNSLILARYYTRNEYTLTFEVNGGAVLAPISAKHGSAISLPETSRYGYVFGGWYLDEAFAETAQITTMPTENVTLYARWTAVGADRGVEYHINGITLLGSDYTPVDSIPNGSFYAQVSVTNLYSETVDTLLLAAYDVNGRMLDLYFLYANPQVGQTFILGALIDNSGGEVAELRAFMLPMLGGPMVSLANSVSTCD